MYNGGQKEERCRMVGDTPWEVRGASLHIRHLSPGVQHPGRQAPWLD